jgi:bacillithiol system protein YtxJ
MKWNSLASESDLEALLSESKTRPVLIFKHSTRCSISATAKARLERNWKDADAQVVKPYYLDLIAHRSVSNRVAELTGVRHESPQAIVLKDGKVVHHASHSAIYYEELLAAPSAV